MTDTTTAMTFADLHETTITPGRAWEANFIVTCSCGARVGVATLSPAFAQESAERHVERSAEEAAVRLITLFHHYPTND